MEPERDDAAVPDTMPELLDYSRLPELAVHFPDAREPADASEFPYRAIGQLLVYYPDGTVAQLTAFLVAPAHIVTVADAFAGPTGERVFEHATFTPGLAEGEAPFGRASVVKIAVPKQYVEEYDVRSRDLALALLDRPIGEDAGYLALDIVGPHQATGLPVATAGYAVDTGAGKMVRAEGRIERYGYPGIWWHDLDAGAGQNGSPIWFMRDGEPTVIAVLTRGKGRHSQAVGPSSEDEYLLKAIRKWIRRNPCRSEKSG